MAYPDKAHQLTQRAPQQVMAQITEDNARFSIDGAGGLEELLAVAEPIPQMGFGTIDSAASAPLAGTPLWRREVSDGVGAHARDQLVAVGQERAGEFGGGIIGVGHHGQGATPL